MKNFLEACINVQELMYKNKYYTSYDLLQSMNITYDVIFNNKNVELLKKGNLKLSKNVLIFDLPSIMTCKMACKSCYALKPERMYKNTRFMRLYHMLLIEHAMLDNNFKEKLLNKMYNEIKKQAQKELDLLVIRWHGSGDFYKKEYLQFFEELVIKCRDIKNARFYTYSKQLDNIKIDELNKKHYNLNIVKSIIDNKYINYGDDKYLQKVVNYCKEKRHDYFVCDYGTDNIHTCMGTCKKCLTCPHVLFHQH